jgi:arabinofuranosyltransferase
VSEPRRATHLAAPLLYALALLGFAAYAWAFRDYTNDDAYITFRYARNLAEGLGPYYNPGEAVEGYTNPSLMVFLAAVAALFGPGAIPGAAKLLGVTAGALTVLLGGRIAARIAEDSGHAALSARAPVAGGLTALLLGLTPPLALNAQSGLETALYAALLAAALLLAAHPRPPRLPLAALLAALVWTRPEGPLLAAAIWVGALAARGRAPIREAARDTALVGGLVALALAALLGARWLLYEGALVPNTYYAKAEGFGGVSLGAYLVAGAVRPFLGWPGLAAGLAGAALLLRGGPARAALVTLAGGVAALAVTGPDWMMGWRFVVPLLAPLLALLVVGWLRLAVLAPTAPRLALALGAAAALASAASQLPTAAELGDEVALRAEGYRTGHIALAEAACADAAPGDVIALMDIGLVGFRCAEQRILDISGLTDAHIARSPGPFLRKEYDPAYILDQAPRFVVLVLRTAGEAYTVPPAAAEFSLWTTPERRLFAHPAFAPAYRRVRPEPPWDSDWLGALAARLGAVRVFEHAHPGTHYLLALFERR